MAGYVRFLFKMFLKKVTRSGRFPRRPRGRPGLAPAHRHRRSRARRDASFFSAPRQPFDAAGERCEHERDRKEISQRGKGAHRGKAAALAAETFAFTAAAEISAAPAAFCKAAAVRAAVCAAVCAACRGIIPREGGHVGGNGIVGRQRAVRRFVRIQSRSLTVVPLKAVSPRTGAAGFRGGERHGKPLDKAGGDYAAAAPRKNAQRQNDAERTRGRPRQLDVTSDGVCKKAEVQPQMNAKQNQQQRRGEIMYGFPNRAAV